MSEPNVPPPPSYTPPPPPTGAASDNRLMIVLSYLGLLCLIPLIVEKDDREVQWHAKHGLVITVAFIILGIVMGVLGQIPFLGCLLIVLVPFIVLAWLIVAILCIMKGVNGERFIIPGISQYADRF